MIDLTPSLRAVVAYLAGWDAELGVEEDLADLLAAVEGGAGPTPG